MLENKSFSSSSIFILDLVSKKPVSRVVLEYNFKVYRQIEKEKARDKIMFDQEK